VPMLAMLAMVAWAMTVKIRGFHRKYREFQDANNLTLLILSYAILAIAVWICIEGVLAFRRKRPDAGSPHPSGTSPDD